LPTESARFAKGWTQERGSTTLGTRGWSDGEAANGNATDATDANGNVTHSEYDAAGRKVKQTPGYPDQTSTVLFNYDGAGNLREQSNRRTGSFARRQLFDDLNRVVSSEDGENNVTLRAYDEEGNLTCEKAPRGVAKGFAIPARASVLVIAALVCTPGYLTRHSYDELNKLTQTTDALGGISRFIYDTSRNLIARIDANNHFSTYEYDSLNQRTAEHQHFDVYTGFGRDSVPLATPFDAAASSGSLNWSWEYDENQNPKQLIDPNGADDELGVRVLESADLGDVHGERPARASGARLDRAPI
jgi:YD repeat-containing protein